MSFKRSQVAILGQRYVKAIAKMQPSSIGKLLFCRMICPAYLKEGDAVRIISTARKINEEIIEKSKVVLESWGLQVIYGAHLFSTENQFAGSDEERASDLQYALDDENCKAIFCARGGYGTIRLFDHINFKQFKKLPKWVIGYSDITYLHGYIQQLLGVQSLHATMPVNFSTNTDISLRNLKDTLFGKELSYSFNSHDLNKNGACEGEIIGGNLSILYSMKGTNLFPDTKNRILFIEDLDEYLYHIDRMMISLKRAGYFEGLSGLIVGAMTDMNDNQIAFGKTAEVIIIDVLSSYNFPICFDFPAGHIKNNNPLILGRKAQLQVSNDRCHLNFTP